MTFSVEQVRADFPVLTREVNGQPLAYLDSAASAQKPNQVIDAEAAFYRHGYAAVHRGIHTLSAEATQRMEAVRAQAAAFIHADSADEIVFVRGTTEGINLVANSWGNANVGAGDNIVISELEHHANIVPWQMLCQRTGAELRVIPLNADGTLQMDVAATLNDCPGALTDDLDGTVDYAALTRRVADVVAGEPVQLLEHLAHRIADVVLSEARVASVEVTVRKPHVALPFVVRETAVTLRRRQE